MTVFEFNELTKLNVTEDVYTRIEKAYYLFPNLSKAGFCTLWLTLTDVEREELILAQETIEAKEREFKEKVSQKNSEILRLQRTIHDCAERLAYEYAENDSEGTKEVAINAIGEAEFYAVMLENGYDLNEYDRDDIANLLRK